MRPIAPLFVMILVTSFAFAGTPTDSLKAKPVKNDTLALSAKAFEVRLDALKKEQAETASEFRAIQADPGEFLKATWRKYQERLQVLQVAINALSFAATDTSLTLKKEKK